MRAEPGGALLAVAGWLLVLTGAALAEPDAAGPTGDLKTFCRTVVDLTQVLAVEGAIPEADASPRELARFERRLARLFNRAERTAPAAIVNEMSFASELTLLDPRSPPPDLGILEPIQAIKRFVADECGFKTVTVTAREHEFGGIPERLRTGTVVFELENEGAEVHELAFGRIKGDASLEELLALPARERVRLNRIQELGLRARAAPGGSDVALVTFTRPGRYSVADFVAIGTTNVESETDGPPHTDEGMFEEFDVEERERQT